MDEPIPLTVQNQRGHHHRGERWTEIRLVRSTEGLSHLIGARAQALTTGPPGSKALVARPTGGHELHAGACAPGVFDHTQKGINVIGSNAPRIVVVLD